MWIRLGLLIAGLGVVSACAKKEPPATKPPPASPVAETPAPTPPTPTPAPAPPTEPRSNDPQVVAGAALWGKYCALCHGARAEGYAADHAPSLISETFLATASDDFLAIGIGRGRPGTAMAGYARAAGGPLSETEVAQLIAFIRNGKPAPPALPTTPIEGDAARGAVVYADKCKECHGDPTVRAEGVHLANPVFLASASDAFIRQAIAFGRPGTKMIGFAGALAESDIDAVVAHIRTWAKPMPALDVTSPTTTPPDKVVINPKGKAPAFKPRDDRFVSSKDVKKALDQKRRIIIVDARAGSDWIAMHIPGAVSVPYYDKAAVAALPDDGTWIIAYCACPHHASGEVVDQLKARGVKNAAILDEGILFWQQQGYPVIAADGSVPKMPARQPPGHDHAGHDHSHHGHNHGQGATVKPPGPSSSPNSSSAQPDPGPRAPDPVQ